MTQSRDFWSTRKAAVQAETEAEETALALKQEDAETDERSDAEILTDLNLPDPDTLQMGDDVSGFMTKAVPDRLRRRALRRLWRLNPVLANVDGLVDYGEDYTDAACVIENLQTAYQVGKGMLAHVEALAKTEEPPEEDVPVDDMVDDMVDDRATETRDLDTFPTEPQIATLAPQTEDAPASDAGNEVTPSGVGEEPAPPLGTPTPRRMRFEFEG